MKLKKKHIIIGVILLSFVIIISTLYLLTFTDFIVKPKYIFSADYNNKHYDCKKRVEISSINSIEITHSDYKTTKENLKYCNNLSQVIIDLPKVNHTNFLCDLKGVNKLSTFFKSDDWSGISGCRNAEEISLYSSNFNDFELFSNFSELLELKIESDNKMIYSGFNTLLSLKKLVLAVENADIKEISKASKINELDFHRLKETLNVDCLSDMINLETLYFGACDIEEETLSEISEIENLKSVYFGHCKIQCSEVDYNSYISDISAKGIDVECEDNEYLSK